LSLSESAQAVQQLQMSDYQRGILGVPEEFNLALLGGRGSGKTYAIILLILRHLEQYGNDARCLFIRRSFPGCMDFVATARGLFTQVYGIQASYNNATHVWSLPKGYLEVGMLSDPSDFSRYQGRSFTRIYIDELTQFPEPSLVDLLWSCLRSSSVPTRLIVAANPGLAGHAWVNEKFNLADAADWEPFSVQ